MSFCRTWSFWDGEVGGTESGGLDDGVLHAWLCDGLEGRCYLDGGRGI